MVHRIVVPGPGINPQGCTGKHSHHHWTTKEVPITGFLKATVDCSVEEIYVLPLKTHNSCLVSRGLFPLFVIGLQQNIKCVFDRTTVTSKGGF